MITAGVVLISLATVGAIGGTALFMSGSQQQQSFVEPPCCAGCGVCGGGLGALQSSDGSGLRTAGIASIAFSVAAMGAGLPLLVVGSKKVPDRGDASLVPAVRFGSGGGSLSWSF
jgi:hypothetical protein